MTMLLCFLLLNSLIMLVLFYFLDKIPDIF